MGFDDKANLTVIHHIGAGKDGAGMMTGNGDLERGGGRHVQTLAMQQDAGGRADNGTDPGDRADDPVDAGARADAGEITADAAEAGDTDRQKM